jgi:glutamyl-tRNA reductase
MERNRIDWKALFGPLCASKDVDIRRNSVEPTLVVIGISLRSAKLALRERFLLTAAQKAEALTALVRSDAIDEVIVLSNCNRTEFLVWTQDASEAANSILRYLTRSFNLKLAEWSSYYRLVGDAAVVHVLRVASGTDAAVFGEAEATNSFLSAWQQAQRASTTGRFLDALMTKAFTVASRVRQDVGTASNMATVAEAAVSVCRDSLGDLERRRVLILGAGQMALAAVREFQKAGAGAITVVNRSWEHAQQLARQCNVKAAHAESLWEQVLRADVVVSAVAQRVLLTREELEIVMHERKDKHIVIMDLSVPRTVDPNVRTLEGVLAHDLDGLCAAMDQREQRRTMLPVAERIIAQEATGFRTKLLSESVLSTISAMRERLELICTQEMDQLREQFGPFTEDQEVALETLSAHISQRISAALARQLKEMPGQTELTGALQKLFQLEISNLKSKANVAD